MACIRPTVLVILFYFGVEEEGISALKTPQREQSKEEAQDFHVEDASPTLECWAHAQHVFSRETTLVGNSPSCKTLVAWR